MLSRSPSRSERETFLERLCRFQRPFCASSCANVDCCCKPACLPAPAPGKPFLQVPTRGADRLAERRHPEILSAAPIRPCHLAPGKRGTPPDIRSPHRSDPQQSVARAEERLAPSKATFLSSWSR